VEKSVVRTVAAGIAGGFALNAAMLVTFRLIGFGMEGGGVLLDPSIQSNKLIAVWTQIEPLPLVVSNPAPILIGLMLFGIGHAFVYRWLAPAWPGGVVRRAIRLAALVFFLTYLFWEFFTPFNQFGEPLLLLGLELVFWTVVALAEAFAIAAVMELTRRQHF
jgi:hypothetical protein